MSDNTLYNKYRPSTLSDVVGQEHVKQYFINAVKKNKLSHAYLFTGTRGVGKTTIARIVSMIYNCENGPSVDYDIENDKYCKLIINGNCPDVHELDAASNSSIQDIREIRARSRNTPIMCRYRVFIIDEVHCVNDKAVSAILKALEEPPKHAVFIFCTSEPNQLLGTIQSRCQRFDLNSLTIDEISSRLNYICKQEGINEIESGSLELVAKSGKGSLRDSISNLETVVGKVDSEIKLEDVKNVVFDNDRDFYINMLKSFFVSDIKGAITLVKKKISKGVSPENTLLSLLENTNDLLISKTLNDIEYLYMDESIKPIWKKISNKISIESIMIIENVLIKNCSRIKNSPRTDILLDYTIVEIIQELSKIKKS
jgi:DNA polymerase-3 subunit gamma/tau